MNDEELWEWMHDLFEINGKFRVLAALKAALARAWEEGWTAGDEASTGYVTENPYKEYN